MKKIPILLKRENGEITLFRHADFVPAFYFLPKSILNKCGAEINSIPRNPRKLLNDWNAIATVESDLFWLVIIDAYAHMVWPFMGLGTRREIYSGYEPSWKFAYSAPYWIYEMRDMGVIPDAQELFRDGAVDEDFGYVSEEAISYIFSWLVPQTMVRHKMDKVIAIAKEYRCFEDFDYRNSTQKIDFYRKWYHSRTQHEQISLEGYMEDYAAAHDGQQWDIEDKSQELGEYVASQILVDEFMDTLCEKDKQILSMRMEGITLEKIAKTLGYQTHSAVLKRIRKIGLAYEKFTGEDFGFTQKKIV